MQLKHMKTDPPYTFTSITLLLDHFPKIWETTFWPNGQRCQKYVYIWKVTSSGRAEIESVQKQQIPPFWISALPLEVT